MGLLLQEDNVLTQAAQRDTSSYLLWTFYVVYLWTLDPVINLKLKWFTQKS